MQYKPYAGIGSRETPINICEMMTQLAAKLEQDGYTLRSGGADGADKAFAKGCSRKEEFPPWDGFEGLKLLKPIPQEAWNIAADLHPMWYKLKDSARAMMARNCQQVLGMDLNTPSKFILCWTADGCINQKERTFKTGGTGQAIAHASLNGISVYNLARPDHFERLSNYLQNVPF